MKKVIVTANDDVVNLDSIPTRTPIFMKSKNGRLVGMVVQLPNNGWVASIGGDLTISGMSTTRKECIMTAMESDSGYEFFVND